MHNDCFDGFKLLEFFLKDSSVPLFPSILDYKTGAEPPKGINRITTRIFCVPICNGVLNRIYVSICLFENSSHPFPQIIGPVTVIKEMVHRFLIIFIEGAFGRPNEPSFH